MIFFMHRLYFKLLLSILDLHYIISGGYLIIIENYIYYDLQHFDIL